MNRIGVTGALLPWLLACAGSAANAVPPTCRQAQPPEPVRAAKPTSSDVASVDGFVETLPAPARCGEPCGPGEQSLYASGSCLCASDVAALGAALPSPERWYFARGANVAQAERDPLMACGEAPLEVAEPRRSCPWSGTELLVIYGTPARGAAVASLISNTLVRVRTQRQPSASGELQTLPFSLPEGATLVGVFRESPFGGVPENSQAPLFVAWRVLVPEE